MGAAHFPLSVFSRGSRLRLSQGPYPIQGGRKLPCKHARFARESLRGANFRVAIVMANFSRTGDNNGGEMA